MKKKLPVLIRLLLLALPLALAGCDKNDYVWSQGAGTFVDLSAMPEGTAPGRIRTPDGEPGSYTPE